ncbi:MAG: hypothetical protein ACXWCP_01335, partial [Burkholderiales bacterium]
TLLYDAGHCLKRFQQGITFDLKKFHVVLLYLIVLISLAQTCGRLKESFAVTGLRGRKGVDERPWRSG